MSLKDFSCFTIRCEKCCNLRIVQCFDLKFESSLTYIFTSQELYQEDSPIADFYPRTFKTDLNGKKQEWEAVVLISFINEVKCKEVK